MKKNLIFAALAALGLSVRGAEFEPRLLGDINPGDGGSFPQSFRTAGGAHYFNAYSDATGFELWKLAGTNVNLAADINPTTRDVGGGVMVGNDSNPSWLTEFNGQLYFSAFEPRRGGELWRFDGAQAVRVTDINPDANDTIKFAPNNSWPMGLTLFEGALYFSANSGAVRENYELWKYDGVSAVQVANIRADSGTNHSSFPKNLAVFGNALYFMADDGVNGFELWRHSGGQTTLLNINPGGASSSSFPKSFTSFGAHLYFQAFTDDRGFELWRTDGAATSLAVDLQPGPASSNPDFLTVFGEALYFRAADPVLGYELLRYDGVQATAIDINPAGDSYPKNLTVFGNALVFAADDGVHGFELWKHDGAGQELITDLNTAGDSFPEQFQVIGNVLYFVATTPETGYEVWAYDGQTVRLAADVNAGPGDSFPRQLSSYEGRLHFSAAVNGFSDWELWSLFPAATNPPALNVILGTSAAGILAAPATITLRVDILGGSSPVTNVVFLDGAIVIGQTSSAPYTVTLTNVAEGVHEFTARVVGESGVMATSAPLQVRVAQAPRITSIVLSGDSILITVLGTTGLPHRLEATTDFQTWTAAGTQTMAEGGVVFTESASAERRFYRVVVPQS